MQSIREMQCRPAVILEVSRPSPASTRDELVELAKQYAGMGADILCLKARCCLTALDECYLGLSVKGIFELALSSLVSCVAALGQLLQAGCACEMKGQQLLPHTHTHACI